MLAASTVNHRPFSFLMCFKHCWDDQEMRSTNGSVTPQSLSEPAPLQQLGGGAILLLSPATHISGGVQRGTQPGSPPGRAVTEF